jgi:GYF domain 2
MSMPTHWYYYKEGRGFGPVEAADICGLLQSGAITADTLVWREGLNDWTEVQSTELLAVAEATLPSVVHGTERLPSPEPASSSSPMAPDDTDAAFGELVSGLPMIAATILRLPAARREIALEAVERSYYEMALGWGYREMRARRWAALVMVALQRAMEDQMPLTVFPVRKKS